MTGPSSDRLASTRQVILEYLQPCGPSVVSASAAPERSAPQRPPWGQSAPREWQDHPARLAIELARPWMARWGQQHPVGYLALAASAGALIVLARPWKLISLTGLLVAVVRSPQLASMAVATLTRSPSGRRPVPER